MALRDYFAAKAMAGVLANHETLKAMSEHAIGVGPAQRVAEFAYEFADAMMEARKK